VRHQFNHRVIYQDTDAEGVVYYANYLGYFERGRTELIRALGISLKQLKEETGLVFAVVKVECDYKAPAFYDDELTIETSIKEVGGATLLFEQAAKRGDKLLVQATTSLISIDIKSFKVRRLPDEIASKLTNKI
jgi:acyl-CoA thioester hydrolase